jgi:hypothetical protein
VNARIEPDYPGGLLERPITPERLRPLARTPRYAARGAKARILARVPLKPASARTAPIFIIGCGRSGTTLLGELFGTHPAVRYKYEPYHLWAAIDPVTDFVQLYSQGECHCLLDSSSVTPAAQRRFSRLMSTPSRFTLVEKSPINALRIGYLDAIAPGARFVHIVRDGIDVAHSIDRMAAVTRRMVLRQPLNEWWGVGDAKWAALQRDGRAAGYYPDEVHLLTTDAQRGAYEWSVSLHEVERWRDRVGSRVVEFRYQDLTDNPRETLQMVTGSLGLSSPGSWLDQATARIKPASNSQSKPLTLPDQICEGFNSLQASFGFKGRATVTEWRGRVEGPKSPPSH